MPIGLSIVLLRYVSVNVEILLLVYQLVLKYISVNRETCIELSISFKMYKR